MKASLRRIPTVEPGEIFGHPLSVTDFPNILKKKKISISTISLLEHGSTFLIKSL